jgi:type VI secretion system secreted protein VgrG
MSEYLQSGRQATLTTILGKDVVVLEGLTCVERMNEAFTINVDAITRQRHDFAKILGSPVHVGMRQSPGMSREFDGLLFEAEEESATDQGFHYRLVLKPWLWLLSGNMDSRIFQNKTIPAILTDIFNIWGGAFENKLSGTYLPREYCVQYRETDYAFVSRLMEEEGICFYFRHEAGRHVLVLTDGRNGYPVQAFKYKYNPTGSSNSTRGYDGEINSITLRNRPGPGSVLLRDYHFQKPAQTNHFPGTALASSIPAAGSLGPADKAEVYDYPGGHAVFGHDKAAATATVFAKKRLEAAMATRATYSASGDAFAIVVGSRFKIDAVPEREGAKIAEYLAIATTHTLVAENYRSGNDGVGEQFNVTIQAIDADMPYRPPLRTPKPIVGGPQPATVVGPDGEVIHVDEFGRVKVFFRWDRATVKSEVRSCWVRVSQAWADGGFGHINLPRIGQEVLVDFLDGDPDEPIIIGRIYNADKMPPYKLPANKTRSTWKSQTVGKSGPYPNTKQAPDGSGAGFNELRFEDKGGAEEIYMHAQRDMNVWVRFTSQVKVGNNMLTEVGYDRDTKVQRHETMTVLDGDETHVVQAGGRKTSIKKNDERTVVSGDSITKVSAGNYTVKVDAGKVLIDAAQEILLKVGSNTVKISPTGIQINGLKLDMQATTTLDAKGLKTTIGGQAMVEVSAPMVKIN